MSDKMEPVGRTPPELLSSEEQQELKEKAEWLWSALQRNELGGYSGVNRPFYILHEFKAAIEKYGRRDVGLTWSHNDLKSLYTADQVKELTDRLKTRATTAEAALAEARKVIEQIRDQDEVEIALDPDWPRRIARALLQANKGMRDDNS
jgi:hypothetical protein